MLDSRNKYIYILKGDFTLFLFGLRFMLRSRSKGSVSRPGICGSRCSMELSQLLCIVLQRCSFSSESSAGLSDVQGVLFAFSRYELEVCQCTRWSSDVSETASRLMNVYLYIGDLRSHFQNIFYQYMNIWYIRCLCLIVYIYKRNGQKILQMTMRENNIVKDMEKEQLDKI